MKSRIFYGWYVSLACAFILAMTVGLPLYAMPYFYDYYIEDFGWNRAQTTGGIAFATIVILPIGGLLIHRFSPRRAIIFGGVVFALALNCFGMMGGSLVFYYLIWCVLRTGNLFSGPIPNQVILSQWFYRKRGTAMGLAYFGLGIGGAISQKFVALPLIVRFGWQTAIKIMGGLLLLIIPVLLWLVRDHPSSKGLHADGEEAPPEETQGKSLQFSDLLRRKAFWLLMLGGAFTIGANGFVDQHTKLLFRDAGLTAALVADTTFVKLVSSLGGRILIGWLADRLPKKYVMVATYLLIALPIPLLYFVDRPTIPFWFAALFGFALGAVFMLIPLMGAELFGTNSLARVMGIILPVYTISQTGFPALLGYLHDRMGTYDVGLVMVFALAMAGAAAIAMLPARPPARAGA